MLKKKIKSCGGQMKRVVMLLVILIGVFGLGGHANADFWDVSQRSYEGL